MRQITICVLVALSIAQTPAARQEPAFATFWSDKGPGGFLVSAAGRSQKGDRFSLPKSAVNRSIDPGDNGRGLQGGGGGVGPAKLADVSTLLIVTAPGGRFRDGATKAAREDKDTPRYTRGYQMLPNALADNPQMVSVGEWTRDDVSARADSSRAYSENLSAITNIRPQRQWLLAAVPARWVP